MPWARIARWGGVVLGALLVLAIAGMWASSLVPNTYSALTMGYVDLGGGPGDPVLHEHDASQVSVADLTGDHEHTPDARFTLTAATGRIALPHREIDGYTVNGTSPGPELRVTEGDLVEVTLVNQDIDEGATLHWHGVDVPNAEDGVAGVTQDAVPPGGEHTYRFVADDAGTYWYHSHQVSHAQVLGGLFGALVVEPASGAASADDDSLPEITVLTHSFAGIRTQNGAAADLHLNGDPGHAALVRVVNTDNATVHAWVAGAPFRVVAVDGGEIHQPTDLSGVDVPIAAGGRVDIEVTMPEDGSGVRVHVGGPTGVVVGGTAPPPVRAPTSELDLLTYGSPTALDIDVTDPDRTFDYVIGRTWGFHDGVPGAWWTINGALYPRVPMFTVAEGDVAVMRIENRSGESHPMHLHGHHVLVLSRNGVAATGSPWWTDSLDVEHGETFEVAFVADNPGIWMDHCHNLPHAQQGLVAHVMYEGVTTPFVIGGAVRNAPE